MGDRLRLGLGVRTIQLEHLDTLQFQYWRCIEIEKKKDSCCPEVLNQACPLLKAQSPIGRGDKAILSLLECLTVNSPTHRPSMLRGR